MTDYFTFDTAADRIEAYDREQARKRMVDRINERMALLSLNPFSAAKKAGLGADYVRDLLRGKVKNPSAERLGKLAAALECSLYYLLGSKELELKEIARNADGSELDIPPTPPPLPNWSPEEGKPAPQLLPIRYELMAETYRKATEVARPPLGFEATTVPLAYVDRRCWWEIVRDDSVARVAPAGSLVLVVEMEDSEREQILHGEFVIISKRLVGPDSAYNLVERSMRQIVYRYPDLGLWFADYAHTDSDLDQTDDVWRETVPTAPRRSLDELAMEIEDPEDREAALAANHRLREGLELRRAEAPSPAVQGALDRMTDPTFQSEMAAALEASKRWRAHLVGKVIRVLTPLDDRAGFGAK